MWKKRGLIYKPDTRLSWAATHAQIPTVETLNNDEMRVFFSCRDGSNRSHIARMSVGVSDPSQILNIKPDPIITLGQNGAFDESGMMPSSFVRYQGLDFLFYIGWNVGVSVPYHNAVGVLVSEDAGGSYRRMFHGPVMDRTPEEPFFCGTTCIRIENGIWRNWYLSCTGWESLNGRKEPRYHLKYAESLDGIHWRRQGRVAVDYSHDFEGAIARASVVRDRDAYRMWYCFRGVDGYRQRGLTAYRIGYAESGDGLSWRRLDDCAGIDLSPSGWDSEMLAYPEVVDKCGKRLMFYNGNGFGKSGFGYAEWENG